MGSGAEQRLRVPANGIAGGGDDFDAGEFAEDLVARLGGKGQRLHRAVAVEIERHGHAAGQRGVRQRIGVRRQVFRQRRAPQSGEQRQQHGKGPLQSHRDHLLPLDARRGEKVPQDGIFRRSGKAPQGGICRRAAVTPASGAGKLPCPAGLPCDAPAAAMPGAGKKFRRVGFAGARRSPWRPARESFLVREIALRCARRGKSSAGQGRDLPSLETALPRPASKASAASPPHQTAPRRKLRLPRRGDRLPRAAACASRGAIRSRCPSARRARTGPPPRRGTSPRRRRW